MKDSTTQLTSVPAPIRIRQPWNEPITSLSGEDKYHPPFCIVFKRFKHMDIRAHIDKSAYSLGSIAHVTLEIDLRNTRLVLIHANVNLVCCYKLLEPSGERKEFRQNIRTTAITLASHSYIGENSLHQDIEVGAHLPPTCIGKTIECRYCMKVSVWPQLPMIGTEPHIPTVEKEVVIYDPRFRRQDIIE
jgi:hypothetical protein